MLIIANTDKCGTISPGIFVGGNSTVAAILKRLNFPTKPIYYENPTRSAHPSFVGHGQLLGQCSNQHNHHDQRNDGYAGPSYLPGRYPRFRACFYHNHGVDHDYDRPGPYRSANSRRAAHAHRRKGEREAQQDQSKAPKLRPNALRCRTKKPGRTLLRPGFLMRPEVPPGTRLWARGYRRPVAAANGGISASRSLVRVSKSTRQQ